MRNLNPDVHFEPTLFIGVGETGAYFTLRERYLHIVYGKDRYSGAAYVANREVRSYHRWNLAQDPDEAFAKATEQADRLGLRLTTTRERLREKLREIERATAEQMEARRKREAEQEAKWAAEDAARRAQWAIEDNDMIGAGRYPFGKLKGEEFGVDIGYLNWVVKRLPEFEEGNIMRKIAERMIELYPEAMLPKANGEWVAAKVGERLTFKGIVTACRFIETDFGGTHLTNIVTDAGNLLVSFGAFEVDVGDAVVVKATVKGFDEFKGEKQTKVSRIKREYPVKEWIVETKVYNPEAPYDGQHCWYPVSVKVKAAKDKALSAAQKELKAAGVAMISHGSELVDV